MTVNTTAYREFHGYIHVLCSIQIYTNRESMATNEMLFVFN